MFGCDDSLLNCEYVCAVGIAFVVFVVAIWCIFVMYSSFYVWQSHKHKIHREKKKTHFPLLHLIGSFVCALKFCLSQHLAYLKLSAYLCSGVWARAISRLRGTKCIIFFFCVHLNVSATESFRSHRQTNTWNAETDRETNIYIFWMALSSWCGDDASSTNNKHLGNVFVFEWKFICDGRVVFATDRPNVHMAHEERRCNSNTETKHSLLRRAPYDDTIPLFSRWMFVARFEQRFSFFYFFHFSGFKSRHRQQFECYMHTITAHTFYHTEFQVNSSCSLLIHCHRIVIYGMPRLHR